MAVSSSRLVWFVRVSLVAMAAAALVTAFVLTRAPQPAHHAEAQTNYACPMHPEVVSSSPGDCPICKMALEPVKPKPKSGASDAKITSEAAVSDGPTSFNIPASSEFRAFDAVSRTKPYPLSLEMRGPAWVEAASGGFALLYRDESELLEPGEEAVFTPATRPKDGSPPGILVRVSSEPLVKWDSRTMLVRFRADSVELEPGSAGTVKFKNRIRKGLVVKASAVLQGTEGPYVFVVSNDRRTMTKRSIEIGNIIYDYAAVVSGLREDEYVACKHTFSLEAERRLGGRATL